VCLPCKKKPAISCMKRSRCTPSGRASSCSSTSLSTAKCRRATGSWKTCSSRLKIMYRGRAGLVLVLPFYFPKTPLYIIFAGFLQVIMMRVGLTVGSSVLWSRLSRLFARRGGKLNGG